MATAGASASNAPTLSLVGSALEAYKYSPFEGSRVNEIRLLRVHPATDIDDPIICDLWIVSLSSKHEYAALSYTWGQPLFDHQITCDGKKLMITGSLHWALRRFRATGWQMLWADQICIDQSNLDERSQQVLLMKAIYEKALTVFVYLGEGSPDSQKGVDLMLNIARGYRASQEVQRPPFPNAQEMQIIRQHPGWKSILDIYSSPYFRRTWIIQEVAVCPSLKVIYSGITIPWLDLHIAAENMFKTLEHIGQDVNKLEGTTITFRTGWRSLRLLSITREQFKIVKEAGQPGASLAGLLLGLVSRHSEATDPRDKIYGLLSLAGDVNTLPKPDYTKDVEAVYLEYARAMYLARPSLLMQAGLQQQSLSLPSWVPDWTYPAKQIDHFIGRRGEVFIGNSNMYFDINVNFRAGNSPTELVVPGFRVDTIDMTGVQILNSSMNLDAQWLLDFGDWDEVALELLLAAENITGCTDSSQRMSLYIDFLASSVNSIIEFPEGGSRHLGAFSNSTVLDHETNHVTSGDAALTAYTNMKENVAAWVSSQTFTMTYGESLYWGKIRKNIAGRAFAITENGHLALVPGSTLVGDRVIIIPGFRNPFVMRQAEEAYRLIGDCYVKEYDRNPTADDLPFEDIVLR